MVGLIKERKHARIGWVKFQILGKYSGVRDSHNNKYMQQISIIALNSSFTYNRSIHFRATDKSTILIISQ